MTRWDVNPTSIDELEHAVHLIKADQSSIETQTDLDRIYRCIKALDAVWAKKSNELEKTNGKLVSL